MTVEICHSCGFPLLWHDGKLVCPRRHCGNESETTAPAIPWGATLGRSLGTGEGCTPDPVRITERAA